MRAADRAALARSTADRDASRRQGEGARVAAEGRADSAAATRRESAARIAADHRNGTGYRVTR